MRLSLCLALAVCCGCTGLSGVRAPAAGVAQPAPTFTADAVMPDNSVGRIDLADLRGSYVILVFYPADFSFVCPTEIIAYDKDLAEFEKRDCRVFGVSVDSTDTHVRWKRTSRDDGGVGPIRYPLIADTSKRLARLYGVLSPKARARRATFLIDRTGTIRHLLVNDDAVGRRVGDTLRVLDAVRLVDANPKVCPANWKKGDTGIAPTPESVIEYLRQHAANRTPTTRPAER